MIKCFCDQCEKEIHKNSPSHKRLCMRYKKIQLEIITGINGENSWNNGHFCHKCIKEAIINGEDFFKLYES